MDAGAAVVLQPPDEAGVLVSALRGRAGSTRSEVGPASDAAGFAGDSTGLDVAPVAGAPATQQSDSRKSSLKPPPRVLPSLKTPGQSMPVGVSAAQS